MTIYLLGDVAEEREATDLGDGGRERAQHLRREVLSFIDDDMAVTAFPSSTCNSLITALAKSVQSYDLPPR